MERRALKCFNLDAMEEQSLSSRSFDLYGATAVYWGQ